MAKAASTAPRHLSDFKPETVRGHVGFVRVGQTTAGQWWLIGPDDRPFFSSGVTTVNRTGRSDGRATQPGPYTIAVDADSGDDGGAARFVAKTLARLHRWNMNTLGAWSDPALFDRGLFYTETLEFRRLVPETAIKFGGASLPDVFNPKWVEACDARAAEICGPRRESTELIGYFSDHELGWAQPHAEPIAVQVNVAPELAPRIERPSLLQICLSLDPSFPAYHAAWEFTLAAYVGELPLLAKAWEVELANKETLRQLTLAETPLLGKCYLRDNVRFTREFARRYFAACAAAIRRHDPHHLVLGCRFGGPPGSSVLAECVAPAVDVLSANDYHETPGRRMNEYWRATSMPILIGGFCWNSDYFTQCPPDSNWRSPTSVERMLARGRSALEGAIVHPAVVGWAWQRWMDFPDDEPPFGHGLVHLNDREAREHTELLAQINAHAESLRRAAARHSPAR
jgi:hypothetical protein